MQQPSAVKSHLQMPQVRLHWQTWMPLQVQQHEQVPSQSILQRFCNVAQDTSSGHAQWILNPPLHFSNRSSHRGRMDQLVPAGAPAGDVPG
jgi:hypothetical protein